MFYFAQVTLPDTGVDVSAFVTAAIVSLGAIVAVVVGGFFAFRLIQWGLTWAGDYIGGFEFVSAESEEEAHEIAERYESKYDGEAHVVKVGGTWKVKVR